MVDRAGKIAYIHGPLFLEFALLNILAGEDAKAVGDEIGKVDADYKALCAPFNRDQKAFLESDPKQFCRALDEFETKYPPLADCLPATCVIKLMLLLKQKDSTEAKAYAGRLLKKAIDQRIMFNLEVLNVLLIEKKDNKELLALGARAAEAMVQIEGGKNPFNLIRLAQSYHINGEDAKAKETARRAIDAAAGESEADKKEIEKESQKLGLKN